MIFRVTRISQVPNHFRALKVIWKYLKCENSKKSLGGCGRSRTRSQRYLVLYWNKIYNIAIKKWDKYNVVEEVFSVLIERHILRYLWKWNQLKKFFFSEFSDVGQWKFFSEKFQKLEKKIKIAKFNDNIRKCYQRNLIFILIIYNKEETILNGNRRGKNIWKKGLIKNMQFIYSLLYHFCYRQLYFSKSSTKM